ncbi:DUF6055 domain-containing protein [Sphingomonas sp. KR1UV-12]|uniref:DUF6055 domain-containing protein n=1 Tax=Sphingomonas aurea TaxID=3063994 RepID=A0ABT9EPM3_9SPHN|nr:DUF6055 domain-containing protein [Sphingomonas sp. KR1UV-12]MDP1028777.1 DUF6055 domain-containing protein [Sphingomonas sp. KR1UV-12]
MRKALVSGTALLALLAGCGGGGDGAAPPTGAVPTPTPAPTPTPTPAATTLGCQSRSQREPWGRADLRSWTPLATTERNYPLETPGTAVGAPFQARLVQAYGEDYGDARRTVILELEDGCRRQFRAESFADADRALIDAQVAAHASVPDTASYRLVERSGQSTAALVQQGRISVYQTQHFAIWYGGDTRGSFYTAIAGQGRGMDQVLRETGAWLEAAWLINRDVLGAPMPFADAADRQKLDIYLCGTGRPVTSGDDLSDCGASAAETMAISAWAVTKGASAVVHELGHMIQFYSGGFRDKGDAGMIWETGAEWNAVALSPSFDGFGAAYLNQLENGFLFSPARYGAWPIFTYLFEKDDTRPFVFGTWLRNRRDANGATQEDYLPAFVRLAQAAGVYPNGFASFADDAGWYGARLAAMDFQNQRAMLDQLRATRTTTWLAHFYTPLAASGSDGQTWAPPAQRPLLQWGTHLVPLTPSAAQVKVTLTGGTTANQAAWRFTLVAVDASGRPTYAPLAAVVGQGSATATLAPSAGTSLYLAVTATPYVYETLGWQVNGRPVTGTRFPYSVRIEGATPRTGSATACDPTSQAGARTYNYTLSGNQDGGSPC